jgi:hypothetical protein
VWYFAHSRGKVGIERDGEGEEKGIGRKPNPNPF